MAEIEEARQQEKAPEKLQHVFWFLKRHNAAGEETQPPADPAAYRQSLANLQKKLDALLSRGCGLHP